MSNRLVIVGAGGFGREVDAWVEGSPRLRGELRIADIAFIDDGKPAVATRHPVISSIAHYRPQNDDVIVCAIGSPIVRRRIVGELQSRGARFVSVIHDSAIVGPGSTIGEGSVVCPNVLISTDISIGEHVHINSFSAIGHDAVIGDFTTLSSACQVTGNVTLGDDVFMGTAAIIHPRVTVGRGARVGMGTAVIRRVPPGATVFGVPAKVVAIAKEDRIGDN